MKENEEFYFDDSNHIEFSNYNSSELEKMGYKYNEGSNAFGPNDTGDIIGSDFLVKVVSGNVKKKNCEERKGVDFYFDQIHNRELIKSVKQTLTNRQDFHLIVLSQSEILIKNLDIRLKFFGSYPTNPLTTQEIIVDFKELSRFLKLLNEIQRMMDAGYHSGMRIRVHIIRNGREYKKYGQFWANIRSRNGWSHIASIHAKNLKLSNERERKRLEKEEIFRKKHDISMIKDPKVYRVEKNNQIDYETREKYNLRSGVFKYIVNGHIRTIEVDERTYTTKIVYLGRRFDPERNIDSICAKDIFDKFY